MGAGSDQVGGGPGRAKAPKASTGVCGNGLEMSSKQKSEVIGAGSEPDPFTGPAQPNCMVPHSLHVCG